MMTFEEWWKSSSTSIHFYEGDDIIAKGAWQAAQQAERERIAQLVMEMHGLEAANLLRKINEPT
jgi:hypothetical protein